ncbi:MAG: class I SAM-dependent RNA methyltransferase [Caulobacteraceae bacterium]|nr:class I SAM-dependent RNA methyltransferase [Caulobacteraceae bacterium]
MARRPERSAPKPARVEELDILRMGSGGDGVAEGPVFAAFTLPGERVTASVAGDRAEVLEVLAPSAERVAPPCPHFGACGGCALQHWDPAAYLAWKVEDLARTLARAGLEAEMLAPHASPPGSRRRVGLHARKGSREVARLGFKARRSWDLVEIAVCPIADARIEAALPALARLAAPLFEHPKSAPSLHVTATDTGLDIDISGVERRSGGLSGDARSRLAEIAAEAGFARVTLDGEVAYGARPARVRVGPATVDLPAGAFLQASAAAEAAMGAFAVDAAAGANRIADLYCGVGAFALRLAEVAHVQAADFAAPAIRALQAAAGATPGLKAITAEARDLVRRPVLADELKKVDVAVIDPPRAGAAEQTAQLARSKVARVVAVSCNPTTFVRDARMLVDAGFRLERVLPVDQFLWSPHMELAAVLSR